MPRENMANLAPHGQFTAIYYVYRTIYEPGLKGNTCQAHPWQALCVAPSHRRPKPTEQPTAPQGWISTSPAEWRGHGRLVWKSGKTSLQTFSKVMDARTIPQPRHLEGQGKPRWRARCELCWIEPQPFTPTYQISTASNAYTARLQPAPKVTWAGNALGHSNFAWSFTPVTTSNYSRHPVEFYRPGLSCDTGVNINQGSPAQPFQPTRGHGPPADASAPLNLYAGQDPAHDAETEKPRQLIKRSSKNIIATRFSNCQPPSQRPLSHCHRQTGTKGGTFRHALGGEQRFMEPYDRHNDGYRGLVNLGSAGELSQRPWGAPAGETTKGIQSP